MDTWTLDLKDGRDQDFQTLTINVGATSSPLLVPTHVLLDQFGAAFGDAANPLSVSPIQALAVASFTRPSGTTPYTDGELIANSVVASGSGGVVPMAFNVARIPGGTASILRARMKKSSPIVTGAVFRLHLYNADPVPANGDGAAWLTPSSGYVGSFTFDFTGANGRVFSDSAKCIAAPDVGNQQIVETVAPSLQLFGLLEAIETASGGYVPISHEVYTFTLEVQQN